MREYGKVGPKFWIGATGKKLRAAGMEAQIVAMYLMTAPHANMLGLYYIPMAFIAHETGLPIEGASKGLRSAIEAGFCEYDEESEVVWVVEMASYQVGESLKPNDLRVKGVQNEYASLPENPFLSRFYDKYAGAFHMESCRGSASPSKAPSKPLPSQEQEQEKEQEQDQEQKGNVPPSADGSLAEDPAKPKKHHGTPEDHEAARWIFSQVLVVNATAREPNWDSWANDVRLMREQDGRTHRDVCDLFRWANKNTFWSTNILSPGKLREKWDTLAAQRIMAAAPRAGGSVDLDAARRAANEEARRRLGIGGSPVEVLDAQ